MPPVSGQGLLHRLNHHQGRACVRRALRGLGRDETMKKKIHRRYRIERDADGMPVAIDWLGDEVIEPEPDRHVGTTARGERIMRRADGTMYVEHENAP